MLEQMLKSKRLTSPLLLDIDFKDSPIGSRTMLDKVTGKELTFALSTVAPLAPAGGVVNHATYGKVMRLDGAVRWYLENANFPVNNITFEMEFAGNFSEIPNETPFIATGGSLGNNRGLKGFSLERGGTATYPYSLSFYTADTGSSSGASIRGTWATGMATVFADLKKSAINCGVRETGLVSGDYTLPAQGKNFYLFSAPFGFAPPYNNSRGLVGYCKSIKVFTNTLV